MFETLSKNLFRHCLISIMTNLLTANRILPLVERARQRNPPVSLTNMLTDEAATPTDDEEGQRANAKKDLADKVRKIRLVSPDLRDLQGDFER